MPCGGGGGDPLLVPVLRVPLEELKGRYPGDERDVEEFNRQLWNTPPAAEPTPWQADVLRELRRISASLEGMDADALKREFRARMYRRR